MNPTPPATPPAAAKEERKLKCARCRHVCRESERLRMPIDQPTADLVCPRCHCRTFHLPAKSR